MNDNQFITGSEVLKTYKANKFNLWNVSSSSSELSKNTNDASTRIYLDYAQVKVNYSSVPEKKFDRSTAIFAMGSCFAREIEKALIHSGCNIVSIDKELINRPEFYVNPDQAKSKFDKGLNNKQIGLSGFFHRFTPYSMLQEFQWCLDEIPHWQDDSLVFPNKNGFIDLNYWNVKGANNNLEAIAIRREVARQLVRRVVNANVIILTLGLIESWYHRPSMLWTNYFAPKVVLPRIDEFEFHLIDIEETVHCLEEIYSLLTRKHSTGEFTIIATVSPVPMTSTFTQDDVIVANTYSKSVLRAAVSIFEKAHENVKYFPSYEMVINSKRDLAWRPDRIHVNPGMVDHIVNNFTSLFFEV